MIAALLIACGGGGEAAEDGIPVEAYSGLGDDASWVFRDDGAEDEPVEEDLLRAHHLGDGVVEFRRGIRWADGVAEGTMTWGSPGGVVKVVVDFGALEGERPLVNLEGVPASGCAVKHPAEVETFYAVFDDAMVVTCEGGDVPGAWSFARGVGLVRMEAEGVTIDLVAPW